MKKILLTTTLLILIFLGLRLLSARPSLEKPGSFAPRFVPKKVAFEPSPLTLETIFNRERPNIATLSAEKITVLVATGDVGLVRSVNFQMTKRDDFSYPFEKTADVLKEAGLTLINLEGPLVENCSLANTGMVFCGNPKGAEGLVFAGVDLANLANNHSSNYGQKGLSETVEVLNKSGITPVEPEKVVFKETKGQKFAFLGYEDVNKKVDKEKVKAQIKEAVSLADVVIVSFHWGAEYTVYPNERQKELAHLVIDSGADLVIGHHPHWIQPIEIYKGKLIVCSHGNFVFDQLWSKKTREGIIGKYTFYEDKLIDAELLPVFINDAYQPYLLEGEEKEVVLRAMEEVSRSLEVN